jgi:predicted naringenin-chalcone synthase
VAQSLELETEQVEPSRKVLKQFGNMSSATILFVLKEILQRTAAGEQVCAMAFGPGLTVEMALLESVKGCDDAS